MAEPTSGSILRSPAAKYDFQQESVSRSLPYECLATRAQRFVVARDVIEMLGELMLTHGVPRSLPAAAPEHGFLTNSIGYANRSLLRAIPVGHIRNYVQ